jgi:hypothetical protein
LIMLSLSLRLRRFIIPPTANDYVLCRQAEKR